MDEVNDFCVTLLSNSSMDYFPKNTQASFRTELARPILLAGTWEVGLSEIFVPRTWFNIENHNNKYSITYEDTKIVEKDYAKYDIKVKIDQGMADADVIDMINQNIEEKCGHFVSFALDQKNINVHIAPNYELHLKATDAPRLLTMYFPLLKNCIDCIEIELKSSSGDEHFGYKKKEIIEQKSFSACQATSKEFNGRNRYILVMESQRTIESRGCACLKSELDLFNVNPVQLSTEDSSFIEIFPVASLSEKTPIEFYISGSGDHYLDLAHTLRHLKVKIKKKSGTAIGVTDQVVPINYLLNTLFSECAVTLNDKRLSSQANYAYRSIFDALLSPLAVQESMLTSGLFTKMMLLSMICRKWLRVFDNANSAFQTRYNICKDSKLMDMIGPLHFDLSNQSKCLINSLNLRIKLERNKDSFVMMSATQDFKIVMQHTSLFVRKVKVASSIAIAHEVALSKETTFEIATAKKRKFNIDLSKETDSLPKKLVTPYSVYILERNLSLTERLSQNPLSWFLKTDEKSEIKNRFNVQVNQIPVLLEVDLNSDIPQIEAVAGHSAEIPCNVSTPLVDDEASLVLWYRVDLANPIYTLDVRNVPINGARHFPASEMEDRIYFNVSVHPPVLVFDPVLATDEADYKCRVDLKRSRTLILLSRLDVIEPPGEPIIMDEHGQHLHDVIGPYDEGSTLRLICEVDGGDPSPEVTWWQGSSLVDDSFNVSKQGFVRNDMILEEIQRSDWMAEYTCKASNTNATDPKEASLQLDMNLLPLEINIIVPDIPMNAGHQQDITCETRENNGKTLKCKSVNPVLPKATLETDITLRVQFPPILNLTLEPSTTEDDIKEGSDIYLECNLSANPQIHNVTWEFEGSLISTNMALGIIILNHTLLLQKVRKDHQGRYRCHSFNSIGKGSSNILHLLVKFVPVCKFVEPVFFGISTTEMVNLTCEVDANPSELQYFWSFTNSTGTENFTNADTESNNSSFLLYVPGSEDGYGTFTCWARNSIGLQKNVCVFKVVPAGPPEPIHDCVIANRTSQSLSVECKPGYNGSLTQIFHMEIYNSVAEYMADNVTNTDKPRFKVTDLSPSTSYVLVIYSSNAKGRSKSVALVAATLSPAKRRTVREVSGTLNPVLGVFIGAIVVVVIIVVIVITIIKTRRCEMEKKELEESQDASGKGPDIIPLPKDPEGG
ncbi:Protein turtle like protein [Argiope bruennichi]|uniref:Protein turtle like protein n=1 Tax=Argiope bruennichi TaxID=94029 RepID=A0A8T0G1V8_ARGBR|nr:Protein turtle like protein [Argiope bruennichi]